MRPDMMLWLDDHRGVYIPRDFANSFADRAKSVSGVKDKDWLILEAGPDHELYWDTWNEVSDCARVTDENGVVYTVYQDGACWLVPEGMEWSEEENGFVWPEDEEAED
jgi:hypothetical protein